METYEIITGVCGMHIADEGTAFPDVDAEPGVGWTDLGETQDGVTLNMEQTISEVFTDQSTGPKKAIRTQETLGVAINLVEGTLENLALVMGNAITTVAPGASQIGIKSLGLTRGPTVDRYSFLIRGEEQSPYGDSYPIQYEIPVGYCSGSTALAYKKDGNMVIPVELRALEDPDAASVSEKFGRVIAQNDDATA